MNSIKDIEEILKLQTVAVVGCSPKRERPSNQVASYLQDAGYRIFPVNPGHKEILGEKCYPRLEDIPEPVDVVDVFRRREHLRAVVEEAVKIKAKAVWLQDDLEDAAAAEYARKHGLRVVMNDCLMRQHLSRFGR